MFAAIAINGVFMIIGAICMAIYKNHRIDEMVCDNNRKLYFFKLDWYKNGWFDSEVHHGLRPAPETVGRKEQ